MRIGSLFAGIGGFDLAAERAGMTVTWQAEIDQQASAVLANHWAGVPNLGDIHGVKRPPAVNILTGGFPCQDYSVAGNRGGLAGDRGALWWQYHRLITQLKPTWVLAENVPGLLSSRDGADFETIIGSLTECGYGVAWAVLDAQYFGVAQRRRRVFIVGHSGGQPRPEVLALSEGLYGHPEPSRETRKGVAGSLETRPTDGRQRYEENHLLAYVAKTSFTRSHGWGILGDGTTHTLDSASPEAVIQDPSVRRLTPLECERLQGFPDGWTDIPSNSDTQRYRQLGNAVAVPVVEWILRRIAA